MLYSCTHMATVGIKGLTKRICSIVMRQEIVLQLYKNDCLLVFGPCDLANVTQSDVDLMA